MKFDISELKIFPKSIHNECWVSTCVCLCEFGGRKMFFDCRRGRRGGQTGRGKNQKISLPQTNKKKMSKQCCRLRDMTQYEAETLFAYLRLANWLVDERLSHDAHLVTWTLLCRASNFRYRDENLPSTFTHYTTTNRRLSHTAIEKWLVFDGRKWFGRVKLTNEHTIFHQEGKRYNLDVDSLIQKELIF